MVRASMGQRRGTRRSMRKQSRKKFKPESYLKEFKPKEKIVIKTDTSSHTALPHPRLSGLEGEVVYKRGKSYIIKLKLGKKSKFIAISPEHMQSRSD